MLGGDRRLWMRITEVTVTAKRHYCEIRRPEWLGLVYKIETRESLTDKEHSTWKQLEREIINIVSQKAGLTSGLTQNNRENARLSCLGCVFIVKVNGNVGRVINIQRE